MRMLMPSPLQNPDRSQLLTVTDPGSQIVCAHPNLKPRLHHLGPAEFTIDALLTRQPEYLHPDCQADELEADHAYPCLPDAFAHFRIRSCGHSPGHWSTSDASLRCLARFAPRSPLAPWLPELRLVARTSSMEQFGDCTSTVHPARRFSRPAHSLSVSVQTSRPD